MLGRLASEMLQNRLNSDSDTVHVLKVKQQLTDRGSCRSPDFNSREPTAIIS